MEARRVEEARKRRRQNTTEFKSQHRLETWIAPDGSRLKDITSDHESDNDLAGLSAVEVIVVIFRLINKELARRNGVVSWTCDPVFALGQRFHSHSRHLFCCNRSPWVRDKLYIT